MENYITREEFDQFIQDQIEVSTAITSLQDQKIEQLERQVQQQEVHIAKIKELLKMIMVKPEPTIAPDNTRYQIDYSKAKEVLLNPQLTDFDRKFLETIKLQSVLTEKQNTFLNNLYLKYE
jgi:uncharacterized coiled-coil protein SlyX